MAVPSSFIITSAPPASSEISPATSTVRSPELKSISVPSMFILSTLTPALAVTAPPEEIDIADVEDVTPIVAASFKIISSLKVTIPAEEICIASVAPTAPTSPSLGTTTFPANVVEVSFPLLGLYSSPVSVSIPCDPVAPSTNVMYVVSSVELFADAVTTLALTSIKDITPDPFVFST